MHFREVDSGAVKRESREKLREAARRREIDVVLSVAARPLGLVGNGSAGFTSGTGTYWRRFCFVDRGVGSDNARRSSDGRLAGGFAEFEREILRERTRAGLAHARQNGKRLGRPPTAT